MSDNVVQINLKEPVNVELDVPTIPEEDLPLKLIIASHTWANVGNTDMPLWKIVGGKEYLGGFFKGPPTMEEIVQQVQKVAHMFEGGSFDQRETVAGWQIYLADMPTNSEQFQLNLNGAVDFPPINLLEIDVEEELERIFANIPTGLNVKTEA